MRTILCFLSEKFESFNYLPNMISVKLYVPMYHTFTQVPCFGGVDRSERTEIIRAKIEENVVASSVAELILVACIVDGDDGFLS